MSMRSLGYAWGWFWVVLALGSFATIGATAMNFGKECSDASSIELLNAQLIKLQSVLTERQNVRDGGRL